jgi:hypothetical protein
MCGDILPLHQYAFMAWCSVKAQGQLYLLSETKVDLGAARRRVVSFKLRSLYPRVLRQPPVPIRQTVRLGHRWSGHSGWRREILVYTGNRFPVVHPKTYHVTARIDFTLGLRYQRLMLFMAYDCFLGYLMCPFQLQRLHSVVWDEMILNCCSLFQRLSKMIRNFI